MPSTFKSVVNDRIYEGLTNYLLFFLTTLFILLNPVVAVFAFFFMYDLFIYVQDAVKCVSDDLRFKREMQIFFLQNGLLRATILYLPSWIIGFFALGFVKNNYSTYLGIDLQIQKFPGFSDISLLGIWMFSETFFALVAAAAVLVGGSSLFILPHISRSIAFPYISDVQYEQDQKILDAYRKLQRDKIRDFFNGRN